MAAVAAVLVALEQRVLAALTMAALAVQALNTRPQRSGMDQATQSQPPLLVVAVVAAVPLLAQVAVLLAVLAAPTVALVAAVHLAAAQPAQRAVLAVRALSSLPTRLRIPAF